MKKHRKIIFGLLYSLIITYIIIFQLVLGSFYHIQLGGGDWGYLGVILGWPIYSIAIAPLPFLFKKFSEMTIVLIPFYVGFILLLIVTFTGRTIFQPFYNRGIEEIKEKLTISYKSYSYLGPQQVEGTPYIDPQSEGTLQIVSDVSFPIELTIKPKYSPDEGFLQGVCEINDDIIYRIRKGINNLKYHCSFSEDYVNKVDENNITYTFRIEEVYNSGIRVDYVLTSDRIEKLSQ